MIRPSLLWHSRPMLLAVLVAAAIPIPDARSQDRAMQDRLDRLERDLSMLQRQVYRGGPVPIVNAGSGAAVDTELRMDRLETQMRELTGRVEDAANGVEQLRRRVEQINSDIELRLGQDQGQPRNGTASAHASAGITDAGSPGPIPVRTPPPAANPSRPRPVADGTAPGTLVPPPLDGPSAGTLTPPTSSAPRREAANTATGAPLHSSSGGVLPAGSASEQYNQAFGLLKQADYEGAEQSLRAFVQQHPNDPLAGSAHYWLGETYYARGRYSEAASAFAEGYKNFPKGTKAPDDLLKLGMSLARANQKHNACIAFGQLDHDFPHAAGTIKERSAAEKKRLGC